MITRNTRLNKYLHKLRENFLKSLRTLRDEGALDNPNATLLQRIQAQIKAYSKEFFSKYNARECRDYSSAFRKGFLNATKREALLKHNKGLQSYHIKDLSPKFEREYRKRIEESLALISTQNEENMQKLRHRLLNWVTQPNQDKTLAQLTKIPTNKRTRFILRDQNNKLESALDSIIADNLGAIAMQWKTRNDARVVGNPSGKYPKVTNPKMHGNHWQRKDQFYIIDKRIRPYVKFKEIADFEDGGAGIAIGCRCYCNYFYDLRDLPRDQLTQKGIDYVKRTA